MSLLVQKGLRSPFAELTVSNCVRFLGFCHLQGLVLMFFCLCVVPIGVHRLSIFSWHWLLTPVGLKIHSFVIVVTLALQSCCFKFLSIVHRGSLGSWFRLDS